MKIHNGSSVCMVMPVYNEEVCVTDVLVKWSTQFERMGLSYTIIAVNDGSTDDTLKALHNFQRTNPKLVVINKENGGHGKAIITGYHEALIRHAQWVFQTDSDDQFDPSDFEAMWENREKSQFHLGIRAKRQDPNNRKVISWFLKMGIYSWFDVHISDANCPFRLMRSDFLRNTLSVLPPDLFAPNIFISIVAAIKLKDFPEYQVKHQKRLSGKPSLFSWRLFNACKLSLSQLVSFKVSLYERMKSLDNIDKGITLDKVA